MNVVSSDLEKISIEVEIVDIPMRKIIAKIGRISHRFLKTKHQEKLKYVIEAVSLENEVFFEVGVEIDLRK